MDTFQPGAAVAPCSKVELSISCRNLRNKDYLSKSDPMCVAFMCQQSSMQFQEIARTEVIENCLDPDFVKKIVVDYFFEESQKMRFEIYDVDSKSQRLADHDYLGSMDCTLGEIVSVQGTKFTRPLRNTSNQSLGSITVIAEEVGSCKQLVTLQFAAKKLDKKDFWGKSDPFLVFYKANEDGSFSAVWKTEVVMKTLNPTWRPFSIKSSALCGGDPDRNVKVQCFDWDSDGGSHDLIGEFSCNLRSLQRGPCPENTFECINPKKLGKKGYQNSGTVSLMSCTVHEQATFLDYIKGGTQLHFTVAVDFTASNGDPRSPGSLHYMDPRYPNSYSLAIQAVGEIIQDYDADKMFPALGFGARLPPNGVVSHEFFLNGNPNSPYCAGVQGVLEAYQRTLQTVQLYGPTNFSPVINHVSRFASSYQDGQHYFVLLIITDGEITDMAQTKEAIVQAASLPMSIIIVGVGKADFNAMHELDGDSVRISSRGRFAERDIVQFVAFRDFLGNQNAAQDKARLAKEVLAEIPDQLIGYMDKRGIRPRPASAPSHA